MDKINQRKSRMARFNKYSLVRAIVSKNRMRYKDGDFNLDLSYITNRVIAMGYPGEGFYSLYRNPMSDVLLYFEKYHNSKVKIYNMCNDEFVNMNRLKLAEGKVDVAYFPMMDHNPGPIASVFKITLDVVIFLAKDPENTVAIHCKAGKGRTGLAICAYLLFNEACPNGQQAVRTFNKRRTSNCKGIAIPSQIRYLDYFG